MATEEEKKSGLEQWAKMFLAETWEELCIIAQDNPAMEEVAEIMYSANSSDDDRYILEARERAMLERKTIEEYIEQQKKENERLRQQSEAQAQENRELRQQSEAQAQENRELRQQSEAQAQENRELRQQSEALERRIEELERKLAESDFGIV